MELLHRLTKSQDFLKWVEYMAWGNFDPPLDPPLINQSKNYCTFGDAFYYLWFDVLKLPSGYNHNLLLGPHRTD